MAAKHSLFTNGLCSRHHSLAECCFSQKIWCKYAFVEEGISDGNGNVFCLAINDIAEFHLSILKPVHVGPS